MGVVLVVHREERREVRADELAVGMVGVLVRVRVRVNKVRVRVRIRVRVRVRVRVTRTRRIVQLAGSTLPQRALHRAWSAGGSQLFHDWCTIGGTRSVVARRSHAAYIASRLLTFRSLKWPPFQPRCPCQPSTQSNPVRRGRGSDTSRCLPNRTLRSCASAANGWAGGAGSVSSMHVM